MRQIINRISFLKIAAIFFIVTLISSLIFKHHNESSMVLDFSIPSSDIRSYENQNTADCQTDDCTTPAYQWLTDGETSIFQDFH
jgi:hypothetical protein